MPGRRAKSQSIELRENIPHPMSIFAATPDFSESLLIVGCLGCYEAAQIECVVGATRVT